MADTGKIKSRIQSVSDTKKVTDAMYMISSVKMRRAKREVENAAPYYRALQQEIAELAGYIPENDSRYFRRTDTEHTAKTKRGILMVTSDKGLSGGYNRAVTDMMEVHLAADKETLVFVVGEYGRQYLMEKKIPFVREFSYRAELADINEARGICTELLEYYNDGKVDEIGMIYTDYKSNKPNVCKYTTLLPLEKIRPDAEENANTDASEMEFVPDPVSLLDGIVPNYLTGFIYCSLIESYCSEQEARMNMMNTAGKNADEMIRHLKLRYNNIRQAAITREMIEITAGVRALRTKKPEKTSEDKERSQQ